MQVKTVKSWIQSLGLWTIGLSFIVISTLAGKASDCDGTSVGFMPLTELGTALYQGFQGGLYPDGLNVPPPQHEAAGLTLAGEIQPLDADGRPDPEQGRIVLVSIGMSNTTQEFSTFVSLANGDPEKNPQLVLVDGAQGGMSANRIINPNDNDTGTRFWSTVDQRLARAGVTSNQVQVAWIKQADPRPTTGFPAYAEQLQSELVIIAQILKSRFPTIRIAYYSSRIYAGYASSLLNPEPYAYESGFSVKWLIERQINGDPELNYDPDRDEVKAPWVAWGPYLWADGLRPRADGLIWECGDFRDDGTHPSESGRRKVANLLLAFFKTEPTARPWFVRSG